MTQTNPPLPIKTFLDRQQALEDLLQSLVTRESPTLSKESVDALGEFVADNMRRLGARINRHQREKAGDHWLGQWGPDKGGVLMLVHLDTVHPLGTLAQMPWKVEENWIKGPGALDMKAGLAMALTAIETLSEHDLLPNERISLLCTSDEETGSHSSQGLIEEQAKQHELVLCLEPAMPNGALKTWRKGIGSFRLRARGQAAHAGNDPPTGVNAIVELAHQIPALTQFADEHQGTTINIGVIQGGTRTNVVPDTCLLRFDVRVKDLAGQQEVDAALQALQPYLEGARLELEGEWNRPPMPRDERMLRTFQMARKIGEGLGLTLKEDGTGGGSDANFVAPLGVPVLDGLGPVGIGAHSKRESVKRSSLPERTALLAAILTQWKAAFQSDQAAPENP
ncbi:MAG: M20 family metallopeptidase [Anaerolineales bacterium]|jgi:glutamate carboxypeptidase